MANHFVEFEQILKKSNLEISDQMVEKFEKYADLLIEWNKK